MALQRRGAWIVFAVVGLTALGPPGIALAMLPLAHRRRLASVRRSRHDRRVLDELPVLADLLCVAVGAGYGPVAALGRVAGHVRAPIRGPVNRVVDRIDAGADAHEELARLGDELGPAGNSITRALRASIVDGVELSGALRVVGADLRAARRRSKEAAIAALPVRLLFPLVVCILPAFALLTFVPLLVDSIGDISNAL